MKKCPFCAEEIQDEAIKCKHCGEFLDGSVRPPAAGNPLPFYFRGGFIFTVICCAGPLALPLIWLRPQTEPAWKIALSLVVIAVSLLLYVIVVKSLGTINEFYKMMDEIEL